MCPVIDAANHSSRAESDVAFEYFRNQFVLSTKGSHRAGDQVLISYGPQGNDSLLQFYGFVEGGNPNDTYTLLGARVGGRSLDLTFGAKGGLTAESAAAARGAQSDGPALARELLAALEAERAALSTPLADDERALRAAHLLGPRALLATTFRAEKKRLLERCISKARKQVSKQAEG